MATRTSGRVPDVAPGRHGAGVETWASTRRVYLDNVKVILVAVVIALHAVLGYAGTLDAWQYEQVREVTLSLATELPMLIVLSPLGFILMPMMFLLAGLSTPGSVSRKGPARFARDRALRLGVPFLVLVFLIWPVVMYALEHPLGLAPGSFWAEFLDDGKLDVGPLWFVAVLLLFSLVYAGWVAVRRPRRPTGEPRALTTRHLLLLVAVVAPASFAVRLAYSYGESSGFTNLNLYEWPACTAAFALGVVASRRAWLEAVPRPLHKDARLVSVGALVAMAALLAVSGFLDVLDQAMGGWHWWALLFTSIETLLAVFGPVWLLGEAQQRLDRRLRWVPPAAARSAYAAFILQGPVLIGLAVAMRPLPLPAEVKALVVAAGGVVACFALAWLMIRRTPGLARVV